MSVRVRYEHNLQKIMLDVLGSPLGLSLSVLVFHAIVNEKHCLAAC